MHALLHDPVFLVEWLALSAVAAVGLWVLSCGRAPWPRHRPWLYGLLACGAIAQLAMLRLDILSPSRLAVTVLLAIAMAAALRWAAVLSSEEARLYLALAVALPRGGSATRPLGAGGGPYSCTRCCPASWRPGHRLKSTPTRREDSHHACR